MRKLYINNGKIIVCSGYSFDNNWKNRQLVRVALFFEFLGNLVLRGMNNEL